MKRVFGMLVNIGIQHPLNWWRSKRRRRRKCFKSSKNVSFSIKIET
jgi:hypothetical protein